MHHPSLDALLKDSAADLRQGPLALIFIEDDVEIASTLRHHLSCGFKTVIALMPPVFALPPDVADKVHRVDYDTTAQDAVVAAVNHVIDAAQGQWIYYCFNAEYLFFPFCETRSVNEMLSFHAEERRDAMLTYVIDLYADDLTSFPNAVSLEHAHLDKSGYYALARRDADHNAPPKERQLDFFGGLRWRFEEHIPEDRRKIDRIGLFRAKPGLRLRHDHTLNDEEYNTYACPWHHNLTAAICSFRTAKALKTNPGSTTEIATFHWRRSAPFEWHSRQLMDLGLIEPGQWF